jgi:drug/metabolite transporter (DMT)-like permease
MTNLRGTQSKYKAILGVLTAATLWGISGTCAQFLFHQKQINAEWLVTVRLIVAGFLLLVFAQRQNREPIGAIWKHRRDAASLVLFSILGMLAVQYTYFAAILHSNAATATILQYLGPAIIAVSLALQKKRLPSRVEAIAVVFALAGTFFIVTHGNIRSLSITGSALFWGVASAFALAFYTLQPLSLLKRWGSAMVVGWGMLLGGIAFSFVHAPWRFVGVWDSVTGVMVAFIIIFGSLIPFSLFMSSVKVLGATDSSVLACAEPLSAAIVAVLWLKVRFGVYDWIGTFLILTTIILLTLKEKQGTVTVP